MRVALVPAEKSERGGRGLFTRRLEIGEAELLVVMRADKKQVLALPGFEFRVPSPRRHQAAQHFS